MPAIASKRQRFTAARRWPAVREQSNEQGELPKFTLREVGECLRCNPIKHTYSNSHATATSSIN